MTIGLCDSGLVVILGKCLMACVVCGGGSTGENV